MAGPSGNTPTDFWSTYGLKHPGTAGANIAEDVADRITMIDPEDHATLTILPKTQAIDFMKHEWFIDALDATATGGFIQGADFGANAMVARSRLANYVQHFRKDIGITKDTQIAAQRGSVYGVGDEMAYQKGKASMEILRNSDARLLSNGAACAAATGDTTAANLMANLRWWATASGITTAVNAAFATATFYGLAKAMYRAGAKPDTLIVGPGVKQDISRTLLNDATLARVTYDTPLSGAEYAPIVEIIRTDFNQRLAVVIDRWCPESSATASAANVGGGYFLIERSKVRPAYWRNLEVNDLQPNGDSVRAYLISALTLEVLHPSCVGLGYGVTST